MFRSIFSCFKKQDVNIGRDYQRMKSSTFHEDDVVDIYNRGSIALKRSFSKSGDENTKNEEVRVVAFGPISEHLDGSTLPEELPLTSRKIARIGLGSNHAVFLFVGSEIAVSGKNNKGQLGIPIKDNPESSVYKGLTLYKHKVFHDNKLMVIDIAAGTNHTMFLTEPLVPNHEVDGEQRQIYVCGDRNMLGKFSYSDSDEPQLVRIERFEENPELRIKFIYSSNEKWIIIDSGNGMIIWGRNFDGFIQREPILFWQFKYSIKRIAVGIRHGLAIDENQKLYVWGDGTYGELGDDIDRKGKVAEFAFVSTVIH